MTNRPDPASVIANGLSPYEFRAPVHGDRLSIKLTIAEAVPVILAALHSAGFLLVHESDRERLIEAVMVALDQVGVCNHVSDCPEKRAVAAVFDCLRGEK